MDIPKEAININTETFKGEIEFRDIWFRYPTRKNEWVFKGLNLKIHHKESVAIVGESGSGKSTLASLIMRFYDPDFGEVLIDGVNIKNYNLKQLRMRMGMVMQEPTLFNYTIKENILYGNDRALNSEVRNACKIANALEFIESSELNMAYDDSAYDLHNAFVQEKSLLLSIISEEEYE